MQCALLTHWEERPFQNLMPSVDLKPQQHSWPSEGGA